MRRPVAFSTVRTSSSGPPPSAPPPRPYAELILCRPLPGMSTMESRGMLTRVVGPLPVCSSMIVSVSSDSGSPVAYSLRCSAVRFALLSEPTINQLVPADDVALSAGSAETRARVPSTYTAKPATKNQKNDGRGAGAAPPRGGRRGGRRPPRGRGGGRGAGGGRPATLGREQ